MKVAWTNRNRVANQRCWFGVEGGGVGRGWGGRTEASHLVWTRRSSNTGKSAGGWPHTLTSPITHQRRPGRLITRTNQVASYWEQRGGWCCPATEAPAGFVGWSPGALISITSVISLSDLFGRGLWRRRTRKQYTVGHDGGTMIKGSLRQVTNSRAAKPHVERE